MDDTQIRDHIAELVTEEHKLLEHGENGKLSEEDRNGSKTSKCSSIASGICYASAAPVAMPAKIRRSHICVPKKSSNTTNNNHGMVVESVDTADLT